MSDFLVFLQLGIRHILDRGALDHILFLLALAPIYRLGDWRDSLTVITAFTVGHSISLALALTRLVAVPIPLVEFLIPLTVVATGLENIAVRARGKAPRGRDYRPVFAGVFGLVHGAGFASYLNGLFVGAIAVPLLGFNVGIEIAQIVVLVAAGGVLALLDRCLALLRAPSAYRVRVIGVSAAVVVVAARMAMAREPW